MIRCPHCKAKIGMKSGDQSIKEVDTNAYKMCWVATLDLHCPQCGQMIVGSSLESILPEEFILAEGAKMMRKRNPHRLNPKSGSAAAKKRWDKVRSESDESKRLQR